jgi:pimeloyl-ACP methyl ester carboxylesterase
VDRARALMRTQNPRGCAQLVRGMKERLDSHDLLEDVRVPALVIAGAQDAYLKAETLRATADAIRGATFVELERVGHLPMLEAPAETADALATFAQRVRV